MFKDPIFNLKFFLKNNPNKVKQLRIEFKSFFFKNIKYLQVENHYEILFNYKLEMK